jgi:undecaprenyl diphosphate synthase
MVALPRHIALVMDGNGRWAKGRGLARHAGHQAGAETLRTLVAHAAALGIEVMTVFAFSSENWRRPKVEVKLLLQLFSDALRREARQLAANNVRLRIIGDLSAFPARLQTQIHESEALTQGSTGMLLQVAANYGGRWDILQAARRLAQTVAAGELAPEAVDEGRLAAELATAGLPEPDIFIRTGGEQRLSNFLLWQCAYSEIFFSPLLWPDFGPQALDEVLADFARRQRRFGMTAEQLDAREVESC